MRRISELHPYLLFLLAGHALIRSLQPLYFYQEQQNYVPSPPTPSSGAKIDTNAVDSPALKQDLSDFIQAFQHVVQKKVNLQTASWYRHIGPFREELSIRTDRPNTNSTVANTSIDGHQVTSSLRQKLHASSPAKKKESLPKNDDAVFGDTILDLPDAFLWDKESDIPRYFEQLYQACSQDAYLSGNFTNSCFGFMQSLIYQSRCTVRLDSRFRCSGGSAEQQEWGNTITKHKMVTIDAKSLIQEHFTSDTINIVILGGGPVGLYFANAMMQLQGKGVVSPMRILIIENRVHQEGYKKPYERDWVTGICKKVLKGVIDRRILGFLDILFDGNNQAIPLNAWETLLLLSNRHRGVKFLFGNANDYHAHLYQVPNLVVFDATGHRLDKLDRGEEGNHNDQTATTHISKWRPTSREMHRLAKSYWGYPFRPLRVELNKTLEVASRSSRKSGSLLYPVKDGKPYDINMIKILNLPQSKFMDRKLEEIAYEASRKVQGWWLGPILPYRTEDKFRPDIANHISKDYPGFPTGSVFINLTPEQGRAMQELMNRYSDKARRGEVPLSHIPVEAISSNPVLQGHVGEALLLVIQYHISSLGMNGEGPIVSWFRYRPYMYEDPVVPGGYDIMGRHVPLLRIGDSLFTGDANAGSGFESHMQAIRFLQCHLANLSGGSCEWEALEGGFDVDDIYDDYARYYEDLK